MRAKSAKRIVLGPGRLSGEAVAGGRKLADSYTAILFVIFILLLKY